FAPRDSRCFLRAVGNRGENRGVKCIEVRCSSREQVHECCMGRSAGSSCTRRTRGYAAWHKIEFMCTRDAVDSVVDCSVENSETAGRDWRCSTTSSNCIESCVVPVSDNIATGGNTDCGDKIDDADACDKKRT